MQNLPVKVLSKIFLIATVCILFAIESHASSSNVSKSFPDGSSYNGEVNSSGIPHGKGTLTWPSGSKYTGDFVDGKRTGKGTYTWSDGSKHVADDAKEKSKEALPVKKALPVKENVVKKKGREMRWVIVKRKVVKKKGREMRWAIHIGSYLSMGEAERIAKMIQSVGDNSYITEHDEGGKHWYRVRVGFYPSQKEATSHSQELSARFTSQELWVVLPTREEVMSHSDSID